MKAEGVDVNFVLRLVSELDCKGKSPIRVRETILSLSKVVENLNVEYFLEFGDDDDFVVIFGRNKKNKNELCQLSLFRIGFVEVSLKYGDIEKNWGIQKTKHGDIWIEYAGNVEDDFLLPEWVWMDNDVGV